ncbi:MAG: NUDIX domain-containing protein [Victivallales bacterium]
MSVSEAIAILDKQVPNPCLGLPDEVFYYISRTTPMLNVDLLIKDEKERTLLSWRDDQYAGKGWHIPGGIVRFKETLETRIMKVAENEVGAHVDFDPAPMAINQIILTESNTRGHFISILYKCYLPATFIPDNKGLPNTAAGYLMWHESCPVDLLKLQDIYRKYI